MRWGGGEDMGWDDSNLVALGWATSLISTGRRVRSPGATASHALVWVLSGFLTLFSRPSKSTQLFLPSTMPWSEGWWRTL